MMIPTGWAVAIDEYLGWQTAAAISPNTIGSRRQHLQHLARRIGTESPWEVTADQLVIWCGKQTWRPWTRHGRRTTFQSFYSWAKRAKRTKHNPARALPKVRMPAPAPRPCPDRVYEAALHAADDRERIMLRLAADHGLRRAEVAVVHSRDLREDLIGWTLRVHGKGRKERDVPLTPRIALELRSLPAGWAFPGDDDGHLSPRWVGKLMTNLLDDDWTMHSLRHRFATRAYTVDRDVFVVQQLLGHASPATTRGYVQIPNDNLRATVLAAAS
jgi:integrase/recombinase XerC